MRFNLPFFGKKKIISECNVPARYDIQGENNKIIIVEEDGTERELGKDERIEGLNLIVHGQDNIVKFRLPIKFSNACINIDSHNASVDIDTCNTWGLSNFFVRIMFGENQKLKIGRDVTIAGANINLDENSGLIIGNDCMFEGSILILPSDGHSVLDCETDTVINRIKSDIVIGNHCWIGARSILTKNAKLSDNCIVGAGSVVTKEFLQENIVVAGNPAKVIKKNVNWERTSPFFYQKEN